MFPLNIPFLPDDDYLHFLFDNEHRLQSVHFSLQDSLLQDARIHIENVSIEKLIESLGQLKKPKKYLLANGRQHPETVYLGGKQLQALISKLELLLESDLLDGLIFADSYMLTALADAAPSLVAAIEAIPSVNFQIDKIEKLAALVELIQINGFKIPRKITLDRNLNRDLSGLTTLKAAISTRWPKMAVELLANEGCLTHCPFRATHEALISMANCTSKGSDTRMLNDNLACVRWLTNSPFRILSSPFIRPEDMHFYAEKTDVIKLCGRTLGPKFLEQTISAYLEGSFHGNLLSLLDASQWMADIWSLPNQSLPRDFLEKIIRCKNDCNSCSQCKKWFELLARIKPMQIIDRRQVSVNKE
jgi:hypothetical protein